jgi:AraC-like DNA-binding protein
MSILRTYSTDEAGRRSRLTYWNDLHCDLFAPIEVKPVDCEGFNAALTIGELGQLTLVSTSSCAAQIERTAKHVEHIDSRLVFLLMPLDGPLRSTHYGRQIELAEGDLVMTESLSPSRTTFSEQNRSIGVLMPYELLARHIPDAETVFGVRLSGNRGLGQLVGTMLRALWAQAERGLPAELGGSLAKSLLDLVAAAYSMEHRTAASESSVAASRRAQIKRFIERHLRDSDLTVQSISAAFGLSPRYMRSVFSSEGESISEYIMRRRLEECAHQLRSLPWNGRSITETAFDWGFSNMAHFTRSFKRQFAATPTQYRRGGNIS